MKCSECNNKIADGSTFCNHCGSKIEDQGKTCSNPQCGKTGLLPEALFCPDCGTELKFVGENKKAYITEPSKSSSDLYVERYSIGWKILLWIILSILSVLLLAYPKT